MHNGHQVAQFHFKGRVKVGRSAYGYKAVRVCKARKHANLRRILELTTQRHSGVVATGKGEAGEFVQAVKKKKLDRVMM